MPKINLSPWQRFVREWDNCQRCSLKETRANVVIARGAVPADVVFIGEAPGKSEDAIGKPFIGPAGHLLNEIIARAFVSREHLKLHFTNLVCCIPLGEDGEKLDQPDPAEIRACAKRLEAQIKLCRPSLIVTVGVLATKWTPRQEHLSRDRKATHFLSEEYPIDWLPAGQRLKYVAIDHPAYILRANYAQRSLLIQKCEVTLRNALEGL